jgi:hypothetical protein
VKIALETPMRGHTPFFELQAALGEDGCPICSLTARALERFFAGLVYEKVNDYSLREAIRRAYGLCAAHGAMLREARSALGVAIIQRDVLRAAAAAIAAAPARPGRGWRESLLGGRASDGLLAPGGPCVGCQLADETGAHWSGVLGQHYAQLRPQLQVSEGLCVSHLRIALAAAPADVAAALREDQLAIWARLEAELDEFIRKHDHQFAGESVGPERDAWARATALLAGDERAAGSRRGRL